MLQLHTGQHCELLVLRVEVLHFTNEVLILVRDKVALREVTRLSGRTVVALLRWWEERKSTITDRK